MQRLQRRTCGRAQDPGHAAQHLCANSDQPLLQIDSSSEEMGIGVQCTMMKVPWTVISEAVTNFGFILA